MNFIALMVPHVRGSGQPIPDGVFYAMMAMFIFLIVISIASGFTSDTPYGSKAYWKLLGKIGKR